MSNIGYASRRLGLASSRNRYRCANVHWTATQRQISNIAVSTQRRPPRPSLATAAATLSCNHRVIVQCNVRRNATRSAIVGLRVRVSSQHRSNILQNASSSSAVSATPRISDLHGRPPRMVSINTASSFFRWGNGSCPLTTSRHTAPNAYTSVYVDNGGLDSSSSTSARISSGAIHLIDPAKEEPTGIAFRFVKKHDRIPFPFDDDEEKPPERCLVRKPYS